MIQGKGIIFILKSGILLSLSLIITVGCSSLGLNSAAPTHLKLLPPEEGPKAVMLKQKVTLESETEWQQFIVITRIDPKQLSLVALTATGQKIVSMNFDGLEYHQENHLHQDAPRSDLLALVQFVHWPEVSIEQHYKKIDGWTVDLDSRQRSLLTSVGILVKVDFLGDKIVVENYSLNYHVVIELLETVDLST